MSASSPSSMSSFIDASWLLKLAKGEVMPERKGVVPAWQDVPPEAKLSLATLRKTTMPLRLPIAVLAIFGNKELGDFEDAAKRTLEFAALPADAQSEKQQSEFPAGVPRPHVTRNWGKWLVIAPYLHAPATIIIIKEAEPPGTTDRPQTNPKHTSPG